MNGLIPDREAFSAACAFVVPIGKHEGRTIARVGSSDAGLRDLDWLVGQSYVNGPFKQALQTFLMHPDVKRLLDHALGDLD